MAANTPRQVALRTSIILSLSILALCLVYSWIGTGSINPLHAGVFGVLTFACCYFLISNSIERFIYDRIKVIYKTIHRFKSSPDQDNAIQMDQDVLEEVRLDVESWADDRIEEIKSLRAKDSFRKEFVGNVAHELKTPVFNIQGYILTLLEGALEDPEHNRKFLEKANASVERMVTLLEDLDAITKIESGSIEIIKERFDLIALVNDVLDLQEHHAKSKNISFRIKNTMDKTVYVKADRTKIEQVLTNLVVNSINYGKDGGETSAKIYDMGENILVEVADDGIGMDTIHLPRIFERFYRVDQSRSRNQGGSGLGLAIVKHLIEAHGQTINVRSTKDVGSTFAFTLEKA